MLIVSRCSGIKTKEDCSRIIFEHKVSYLRKFYIHNLNLHEKDRETYVPRQPVRES